jgi:hypothetical protein
LYSSQETRRIFTGEEEAGASVNQNKKSGSELLTSCLYSSQETRRISLQGKRRQELLLTKPTMRLLSS